MPHREEVHEMLLERRFDPTFAPFLETYVHDQIKDETHDLDANLALLRFYQYNPSIAQVEVARKVLTKALMAMPATDFMLCMYIIPPSLESDPTISGIKLLADYLESCFFEKFWNELPKVKIDVPGFEDAIRTFIAGVITATFKLIEPAELQAYLNISGADIDKTVAKYGWEKTNEGIKIPRNESAQGTVRVKQEEVNFEHIAPIVVASALSR